ncbi:MAG TPA: UDP-N-acetylmuramoyl-tripeptide--D-alanyl-D-alanine ligase [Candidatus Kapabacteria bacterium]|nr:UDP-N-acetylmuramoyl-tripeptide--D-alanyl-D-alanine ligase [Candidatus Kapabacteria bacterium]
MNLTVQELQSIPHIEHSLSKLDGNKTFRDVSTDSRTLKRGDLFVALRGEKFDGHAYLEEIAQAGAVAAIVDQQWVKKAKKRPDLPLIVVEDTLQAHGDLANLYRRKFKIPILVVAGSNGKTTTKELLAHVLGTTRGVLKTESNYNNQVGLPKMLFQLRDGHDMAVLEIGTNHPGEIEWLCKVAEPTHAYVTNVGREHLEFFKDLKGVAAEERAAFDYVFEKGGTIFVNMDDKYLASAKKQFGDRAKTFGTSPTGSIFARYLGYTKDGRLELRVGAEDKSFKLRTHIIADYAPNMIAGAVAVGLHFKMRRAEIKAAIEYFKPHDKRLEVVKLSSGVTVLNDTYNANPDSMESAFKTLASYPAEGKRYVIVGDMFELGERSETEHKAIGKKLTEFDFAGLYFTGKDMELAYKSAKRGRDGEIYYFKSKDEAATRLRDILSAGDTLLVKGSRGMKMEEVIDLLQR